MSLSGNGHNESHAQRRRRARGLLAMVASGEDAVVDLPYYPYQPSTLSAASSPTASAAIHRGRRRRRERRRQEGRSGVAGDLEGGCAVGFVKQQQSAPCIYDHEASEFTLLYFADSTCRNCLRFNPILARFLQSVNSDGFGGGVAADHTWYNDHGTGGVAAPTSAATSASNSTCAEKAASRRKVVQCICVPNDTTEKGAGVICRELGTYCLPFNHKNRLALIR